MKKLWVIAAALIISGTALAQPGGGQGTPNENANCLAQERAQRNSAGGDRNPGVSDTNFGQQQSAFIATLDAPYGQFLQDYKAAGCPGSPQPD